MVKTTSRLLFFAFLIFVCEFTATAIKVEPQALSSSFFVNRVEATCHHAQLEILAKEGEGV